MTRKILHIDMDAFFTSVEQRDNPSLKGRPIVVGGSPEGRGVVAAASYEARKFGVKSAMPCGEAKRRCPHLIFVKSNFQKYVEASKVIRAIFKEYSDIVEPLSIDEAFIDVTTNKIGEPLASVVAKKIRAQIFEQTKLTASAGVAPCKMIAKIASDMNKPNGITVISPEKVFDFLTNLPCKKLWGVGPVTAKKLADMGIKKIGDVRNFSKVELRHILGKWGPTLHDLSFGIDPREVSSSRNLKSRGAERTFSEDLVDEEKILEKLEDLTKEISGSLKKKNYCGKTVIIKVRYEDFDTITRSKTLGSYTDEGEKIFEVAKFLMEGQTDVGLRPVRLIGVSLSNLIGENDPFQVEMDFLN